MHLSPPFCYLEWRRFCAPLLGWCSWSCCGYWIRGFRVSSSSVKPCLMLMVVGVLVTYLGIGYSVAAPVMPQLFCLLLRSGW
jgi:hypothetical protein